MSIRSVFTIALLLTLAQFEAAAEPFLLRTVFPLDDERGYCVDVSGFGPGARIDEPLQVHTCKYGAELEDQIFERTANGAQIELPAYGRCLAAESLTAGASVLAQECADTDVQRWQFEWGQLSPTARRDLCVTLADGPGEIAGTPVLIDPVYRSRRLSLELCRTESAQRQSLRYGPVDERRLSTANVLRSGLPPDIAARLEEIGNVFGGEQVREMMPRVAAVPRTYESAEIEVIADVAYGPDERHSMDIRRATARRSNTPLPVVVTFHGGGLVGGNKEFTANTADYFASLGFIGINAGYRLAPDHPWPAGPLDVGRAVTWLSENIADYGGDPNKIFVLGISSGSLHSAGYVFRADLLPRGTARAAGAILMSGPYTFDFQNAGPSQLAYYGEDPARYAEKVVVGNVTSTDIPVLFTTAEWDPPRYTTAFAQLFREIVIEHGIVPRYHQSLGHNHESQRGLLGTAEKNVSVEIIDFIERVISGHAGAAN
ncbi:MAG: alpha/beta hydrolase fold domain-containing protein [Gammaproteobacteria bacterium]